MSTREALSQPVRRDVPRSQGLVAWRFWDVTRSEDGLRLCSPYRGVVWQPLETLEARCLSVDAELRRPRSRHEPPGERCRCGVYGGSYSQLEDFLRARLTHQAGLPVLGRVLLWGRLVPDEGGWRASHAYPVQLLVSTASRNTFEVAAALECYGVQVGVLDARDTFGMLNGRPRLPETRHLKVLPEPTRRKEETWP